MGSWFRRVWAVRSSQQSLALCGLSLLGLAAVLDFSPSPPAIAQYAPVATSPSNPWQYASFPVENFQAYTSGFGPRRSPMEGASSFHNGLDLAAPIGSYVRNWWHGYVVEVSDHTACGTMIRVQSGEWQHIYCHLMGRVEEYQGRRFLVDRSGGIMVQQGQALTAGMRIGRVGMTGRTTGPHLHWGLKHNGIFIDPARVLQAMYQGAS